MRATTVSKFGNLARAVFSVNVAAIAVHVGNNPHPVASVGSANGGSWYAIPCRVVPERGQVSENFSHPEIKQAWDVLHDDEAGS